MDNRFKEYLKILRHSDFLYDVSKTTMEDVESQSEKTYSLTFAPIMVSYVVWLLSQAKKQKIKRLYFLARDAYPMYEIAKSLKDANLLEMEIDIRYLRVSRYSLRLPEYHLQKEKCLDQIFLSGIDVSLYRILKRGGLSMEEMKQVCRELHYEKELHDVLNRSQILQLKKQAYQMCKDGSLSLLDMIMKHSKKRFLSTIGYLKQEGMLDGTSFAVVDSGWVGSIQKSLRNLLKTQQPGIMVRGYYFGLYELPKEHSGCEYSAFYFGPTEHIRRKAGFSNCLFETIFSENCGMVKHYKKTEEGYEPILSQIENPNGKLLEENHKVLQKYIKNIQKNRNGFYQYFHHIGDKEIKIVEQICSKLMSHPTNWEAEFYGSCMFSDDLDDSHMKKAANELSQKEIRDLRVSSKLLIALGLSKKVIHESAWIEGTIVNGRQHISMNLFFARFAKIMTYIRQTIKMKRFEEVNV
ncbi:MAG: hypothetical protein K6F30_03200 [Lachnospiraceae bacterium]|nr:hypothetical protein [Lachnospiraceae bacterium]